MIPRLEDAQDSRSPKSQPHVTEFRESNECIVYHCEFRKSNEFIACLYEQLWLSTKLCKTKIMTWPSYKQEPLRSPQNKETWDQLCPGGLWISWCAFFAVIHCHKYGRQPHALGCLARRKDTLPCFPLTLCWKTQLAVPPLCLSLQLLPLLPGGNATVRPLQKSGRYLLLITPVTT